MNKGSHEDRLAEIMQGFTDALPGKISDIEKQWQAVRVKRDPFELRDFAGLCHAMAGSAGTFNHSEIGDCARQVDTIIRSSLKQGEPLSKEETHEINQLVESMRKLVSAIK